MIVKPQINATPDRPVVRFREERTMVDLNAELPKILRGQGWGVGVIFSVQFISRDETKLLAMADFVVTGASESMQTNDLNPNQPITSMVTSRTCAQISPWVEIEKDAPKLTVEWNVGRRAYEVKLGDAVLAVETDKDKAQKIAAGELPLPAMDKAS